MRENARLRTPASITVKVDPEKRDWMQAYALHLEVSGESIIRRRIAAYIEETGSGKGTPFEGSLRPSSPSKTISFKVRLDSAVRDAFVAACDANRTTPSIVIRSMIDGIATEAMNGPDREAIEAFKRESAGDSKLNPSIRALPAPEANSVPQEKVDQYIKEMKTKLKGRSMPAPMQELAVVFEDEEGLEEVIDESTFTDTPPEHCSEACYEAWLKWRSRQ